MMMTNGREGRIINERTVLQAREHCVIIGDSLRCKALPLSLGWSYAAETTYNVNAYEHKKEQRRSFAQERQ